MNFRELINQLHTIDQPILSETVTLDSIMAAVGNETDEQKRADLLQKMAEKENLPGLYDPISGYFVSVFQDREPMTNQLKTRISSTASSAVTNQLADLGLVPGKANTRSLGGLVGVGALSNSTEKNDEMDQEVKNRFKTKQPTAAPVDSAQAAKVTSADEEAKMTQLEGLVDQYLKLKEAIKTGAVDQAVKVTPAAPLTPTGSKVDYRLDPEGKAKLNAMNESDIAQSLIESFGYQKKTSIAELIESFGYRKNHPYSLLEADADLSLTSKYDKTKDAKSKKDDDDFDPDAYLQSKYGDADDTTSGRVDNRTWQEKNVFTGGAGSKAIDALGRTISGKNKTPVSKDPQTYWDMAVRNKYWNNWTEDSLSWEDEIIPGVYSFKDLGIDLGIAAGFVLAGTIMAPFTAGASVPVAYAGAGAILVRSLIRIGWAIIKAVMLYGKPFWKFVTAHPVQTVKAVGQIAKTHAVGFYKGLVGNLSRAALMISALASAGFNGAALILKELWPEAYKAIGKGFDSAVDTIQPGIDWARKKIGLEEGLQ
jgi:hypothetical protein